MNEHRCDRHYADVFDVLSVFADPSRRRPCRGTEGVIGRAQHHFDLVGETDAVEMLDAATLAVFQLRHALWSGDQYEQQEQAKALGRLSRAWLREAPMKAFPPAQASA